MFIPKRPPVAFRGGDFPFDRRYQEIAVVVGDRIRRLRLDRKMTLIEMADQVPKTSGHPYSASYMSRLERGWAHAPIYVYHWIAKALEVDQWALFAEDHARQGPSAGELVLLRFLRGAGISPEDALVRLARLDEGTGGEAAAASP